MADSFMPAVSVQRVSRPSARLARESRDPGAARRLPMLRLQSNIALRESRAGSRISFRSQARSLHSSGTRGPKPSHSPRVEDRLLAGAVALERALLANRIGTLEDPVLPGGEAGEDFRFHGLGAAEAQIGFEPGKAVGREARALLEEHADLVFPVDIIEREGDEAELLRRFGVEHLADLSLRLVDIGGIREEAAGEPRQPVAHGKGAEIDLGERQRRGWLVVAGELPDQHVGAVAREHELGKGAGETRTGLDEGDQRARSEIDALERALPQSPDLAREPVVLVGVEEPVIGEHLGGVAGGFEQNRRDVEFIGADVENGIVELTRELERPERGALSHHGVCGRWRRRIRPAQRDGRKPRARRRARFRASVISAFTRVVRRAVRAHLGIAALATRFDRSRLSGASTMPLASPARDDLAAKSSARCATVSSSLEPGTTSSTSRHSTARLPLMPSSVVQNTSAWSRRTLRLSVTRVSPPVPGSTASSGSSGSETADEPSSISMM